MTPSPAPARPLFLPVGPRAIFCLHHAPAAAFGPARGAVVYVPPFTEEMNKSRRMAALQSRALAGAGWHVLQIDLCGTGDSEGDFADAGWSAWLADVAAARAWLAAEAGSTPWLWGLRLGALLAAASLAQVPAPGAGFVGWQPVVSGRQHLHQFLRLKAGADWVGSRSDAPQPKPMEQLQAGQTIEVAGYAVASALALPMAQAELRLPADLARVAWFEVSPRDGAALSPAADKALAPLRGDPRLHAAVVSGPSFWAAQEIEVAPALVEATNAVFAS